MPCRPGVCSGLLYTCCMLLWDWLSTLWEPRRLSRAQWWAGGAVLFFMLALLALVLFQAGGRPAVRPPGGAPELTLKAGPEGLPLTGVMGVFIDTTGRLGVDEVRDPVFLPRFEVPTSPVATNLNTQPYWFRIPVRQTGHDGDWLISVPSVAASELAFHGPYDASGQALAPPVVMGITHPYSARPLGAERMVYRFHLAKPGDYVIYLRAVSRLGQVYALTAWDTGDYMAGVQTKRLFDGLSYGVLLGMLAYNLVLLVLFRDRVYAYYLLNCASALLTIASFNGHVARYLWPDQPWLAEWTYVLAPAAWIVGAILFARRFLDLARYAPLVDRLLQGLMGVMLLSVVLGLMGHWRWLMSATEIGAMVGAVTGLAGALLGLRHGYRPAGLYILGLIVVFAAAFLLVLSNWGVLHWTAMHLNVLQLGVAAELLVFSVALGTRIRVLRRAQSELHARAEHLAIVAETDTLTGAANRAGLAQVAQRLLQPGQRHALLLLDLDNFKPINDRFGHEAGDQMLQEVARRLREQVRPADVVARLGGDEFVILLMGLHDRQRLGQVAHRVLQSVRAPMAWQGQPLSVGASLGLARFPDDGANLPALLRAADRAMYHVKQDGQTGFAFHEDLPDAFASAPGGL